MKKTAFTALTRLLAAVLVAGLLVTVSPGHAADNGPLLLPPTTGQKIYFLFHKLSGRSPGLSSALKNSDAYRNGTLKEKDKIMRRLPELEEDFAATDPKSDIIVIRTAVKVVADMGSLRGLHFSLPGSTVPKASIYFPYAIYGMNIAVIPNMIEPFMDIPLSLSETEGLAARLTGDRATMVLEMQPMKADGRRPMMLDNVSQWLVMGRMVGVTYYNQNLKIIWSWKDKNYIRAGAAPAIQDLKK